MLRRCWTATPIVIALLAFAPAATAAVTVDNSGDAAATGNDCMPAPNDCSLRQAIAAAAPHGTVVIPAAVGKIELDSQLQVTKPLAIRGAGRDTTILSGQDKTRVLRIDASGGVTLARLRISHGRTKVTTPRAGGAGIFVRRGDLTLDRVRVTRNRLTATGASGMLVEDQGGAGVYSADRLTVRDSQITYNLLEAEDPATGGKGGGGILAHGPLRIEGSDVSQNNATLVGPSYLGGGGLLYRGTQPSIAVDSDFNGNAAMVSTNDGAGGGIYDWAGGGAIYDDGGGITLVRSGVAHNNATIGLSQKSGGGGIFESRGGLRLVNSSVGQNALDMTGTPEAAGGAAVYDASDETGLDLRNATIGPDLSPGPQKGAEILNTGRAAPTLLNTIVEAPFKGHTCRADPPAPGTFSSLGHNVESADECNLHAAGDQPSTDVDLDAGQYGGPTSSIAPYLLASQPAVVNRGDPANCPPRDQRGVRRPQGAGCDVGAIEIIVPRVTALAPTSVGVHDATVAATVISDVAGGARVRVDYGRTAAYTDSRKRGDVAGGRRSPIRVKLDGLEPSTTYHYRFVVTAASGTATTADHTFTTH